MMTSPSTNERIPQVNVVIALGANLGDRLAALHGAVDGLRATPGVEIIAVSSVYETEPVGGPQQPEYANAVVLVSASIPIAALLERAHEIETAWDRVRAERWGPRTLDIDIIDAGGEVSDDPVLTLPHPRAYERGFVIIPWLEIEPDAVLVGYGPIRDLKVDATGVRMSNDRIPNEWVP
ncbi:MAG: 2-amino-4-hydroxy-6-hydroxymethyldihydropteridine diphosphokinase [Actinobacteria bacterium]|uniref:2-amino-4-hydroxy-6-hydroxymethyldihydropteridine diphosphokinase n=1 Tax=freshwater metagenome TaxID=449393 RepID=A0A6J7IAW6_9ZZZZ|nr:2-amino-4-hydroxy-6-hydroxymethyldihydropteridine diphosphokinase [Actinomycetota bacterium]